MSPSATTSERRTSLPAAAAQLVALLLLATAQLMVVLDMTIVNVALPSMQRGLHFSVSGIAWVVNAYALPFGALLLLGGRSGDLLGRRNVFVAALLAFAGASALGGLATTSAMLVAARVLQGSSAAFAQASALALIVSTFAAGRARNRAVGVFAAMEGLGSGLGLLLGGVLVQTVSWRWVFFVNVPVAALVAALAPRSIPAPTRIARRFDLPGALTASAAVGLLVFGLSRAADQGWTSPQTILPISAGIIGLAAFVLIESRTAEPLMPLWVFRDRNRSGGYTIQMLLAAALFGFFFLSTLFLQQILGYGPLKAGAAFIPGIAVMILIASIVSSLVARTGVRPLVAAGTATAAGGMLMLSQLTPHSSYLTGVMLPMIVLCAGLGLTFVPTMLAAVSGVDEQHSGLVSGVSTTALQIGGRNRHRRPGHHRRNHQPPPTPRHTAHHRARARLHTRLPDQRPHHRRRRPNRNRSPSPTTHTHQHRASPRAGASLTGSTTNHATTRIQISRRTPRPTRNSRQKRNGCDVDPRSHRGSPNPSQFHFRKATGLGPDRRTHGHAGWGDKDGFRLNSYILHLLRHRRQTGSAPPGVGARLSELASRIQPWATSALPMQLAGDAATVPSAPVSWE